MPNRFKIAWFFAFFTCMYMVSGPYAYAQAVDSQEPEITKTERLSLAKEFLRRMRSGFSSAEQMLKPVSTVNAPQKIQQNILPEGEQLLFEVALNRRLQLEDIILGQVSGGEVLLSLKDFVSALEFPIYISEGGASAQGWYIRENKAFTLDAATQSVQTASGSFVLPETVLKEADDIFVPKGALEQWFDMEIILQVSGLQMFIIPSQLLPIQERINREKKQNHISRKNEPVLPIREEPKQLIDVPFVDVATSSRYDNPGRTGADSTTRHTANIRTAGDFAYGTLSTQTQINDEDKITNIRVNYKQESLDADLLGPLKAKRFEVGDVIQTRLPIDTSVRQELGARITNADPLRTFTNPTTAITGTVFPGWDVELYRGNQFLGFQRVGDDGFYSFDNVILFGTENNFRVVFYGPQGEVREEEVSIPVDINRIAEGGGTYDVSLTFDNEQTYRKFSVRDEDKGSPTLLALYEKPLAPGTVASVGFRSNRQNDERNNVLYGGVSKVYKQTLFNANAAIDDEAELAAEFVARRNMGSHDFVSTTRYFMDNFDTALGGDESLGVFDTRLDANGKLPINFGLNPRYSAQLGYSNNADGDTSRTASLGFNTAFKNFTFNEQLNYRKDSTAADSTLNNIATVTGTFGRDRVRLRSDYEINPDAQLRRVIGTYTHDFNRDLELDLEIERRIDPSLTEASAQLNWQAGWARISPSIRYNSDNDLFAGLNTNFGLARDPQQSGIRSFDRSITSNGGISVFVFLDENGDGQFNENEKPLEGVAVRALQNGGREETNENGIAYFERVTELRRTDVFVEEETLEDPFWISGFEGVSIIPREGYVAELQFPIHIAGELDGTLYARRPGVEPRPLRGIPVHLYNAEGEIEQTANTDIGGFYLFSSLPPGRYLLLVDEKAARASNFARPKPQPIEIGYEGTIIYGNDVFVDAGQQDIPSTVMAGLKDYKALHPHINFANTDYNVALNIGEYNSRLLMSTVWYRLHTRYRNILSGGQLMVLPQHSYADAKTGKHTLRIGFHNADLQDAYNRCRALIARNIECKVEVLPATASKVAMGQSLPG